MLEKVGKKKKEKNFPKYLDSSKGVQRAKGARADVAPGSPFWRLVCSRVMCHTRSEYTSRYTSTLRRNLYRDYDSGDATRRVSFAR